MNIQTERLEDHTARFTVAVEVDQLESAKKAAARRLAKRVNIPGFRKGKAPYNLVVNYIGEAAILEDAIEALGNEIYKKALDEAGLEPYGPGSLEDVQVEGEPVFKFIVPLQPTADLGDYRAVRKDYEAPALAEDAVEKELQALQEREAEIAESDAPVALGNRVTVNIVGKVEKAVEAETAEDDDAEAETDTEETTTETFIDRENVMFLLTEAREPIPGFSNALVGATVDEERSFSLVYPEDEEEYGDLSGKPVQFEVKIVKIETMDLPELNDEFAAKVTAEEGEPLTLEQLRARIQENLQNDLDEEATAKYAETVLADIAAQATVSYPEAMVSDQVHHLLEHVDRDLRQRGISLEDYMKVTGKTHEDLHVDYNDQAVSTIERTLVLQEVIKAEKIEITDEMLDSELDRIVANFGDQAAAIRDMYKQGYMLDNLRENLLSRAVYNRIAAIGKGEAPALEEPTNAEVEEQESASDE